MPFHPSPDKVLSDVYAFAGGGHSMAIRANGDLWTWGSNSARELADGTTVDRRREPAPATDRDVLAILYQGR